MQDWKVQAVVKVDAKIVDESVASIAAAVGVVPDWPGRITVEVRPVVQAVDRIAAKILVEDALIRQGIQVVFVNAVAVQESWQQHATEPDVPADVR